MIIDELLLEALAARDRFWFVQTLQIRERTDATVTLRFIISPDLFVQVFLSQRSGRLSFALVGAAGRLYGRDREHGLWHRHPFGQPEQHEPTPEGMSSQPISQFLTAMVDVVSNGRIDVGFGRGSAGHKYNGYGLERNERQQRFQESIRMILGLWTTPEYSQQGQFYTINQATLVPPVVQQPHPPVSMAATRTPATLEFVVSTGQPLLVGMVLDTVEALDLCRRVIRLSAAAGYHIPMSRIPFLRCCSVAETDEQAWDRDRHPPGHIPSQHRGTGASRLQRVIRPMSGCTSFDAAHNTLVGIARMHMIKKRQLVVEGRDESLTAAELFYSLAA